MAIPAADSNSQSPLHDVVRQLFANHPQASPDQIAQGLVQAGKVDPALAHRVVGDVAAQVKGGGGSPPMGPTGPGPLSGGPANAPAAANAARLTTMQNAADTTPQSPNSPPIPNPTAQQMQAPASQAPGAPSAAGPLAASPTPPNSGGAGALVNGSAMPPPQGNTPAGNYAGWNSAPAAVAPNSGGTRLAPPAGTTPAGNYPGWNTDSPNPDVNTGPSISGASNAPPAPSRPNWLSTAGRALAAIAPVGAALAIGSRNPSAGAALLQGLQGGRQQTMAEARQRQQDAQTKNQQDLENRQSAEDRTNKSNQQQFENREAFLERLRGEDSGAQEREIQGLTPAQTSALGIDKTTFYDKDGKFVPIEAAPKAGAAGGLATQIARAIANTPDGPSAHDLALKMDPTDSTGFVSALSMSDGSAKPSNPFYGKAPSVTNANTRMVATEQTARDRFAGYSADSQQTALDKYKGAPEHFKQDYGFRMPDAPILKETDALGQGRLTVQQGSLAERVHHDTGTLAERTRHDKAQEIVARMNADSRSASVLNSRHRADTEELYKEWVEGGGKSGQFGVSPTGNPWGKIFDNTVKLRDATVDLRDKAIAKWRKDTNAAENDPIPRNLTPDLDERIARTDLLLERMNKQAPPAGNQTLRSWQGKPGSGGGTDKSVDPNFKQSLRSRYGL